MADQGLFDALSGAAGHPINRPAMDSYVATSQAMNGLRSAQTEDALVKAQQAQQEMSARDQVEQSLGDAMGPGHEAEAHAAGIALKANLGNYKAVADGLTQFRQLGNRDTLSDPSQLGTPAQTAAQQGIQGKVAEPVALPNNFTTLPGAAPVNPQQSAQGVAQLAQTRAMTGKDIEEGEAAHARALASSSPTGSLDPQTLKDAAQVVMADPTKMSQYAGFGKPGQANKDGINNEISRQLNGAGMSVSDMIRQRAIGKASIGSAAAAAKQGEILDAFQPLVKGNSDRIMQILDQDGGTDIPIVEAASRALGRNLGSDDMAELHSVFGTYQKEVARMIASSPTMAGVISDKSNSDVQSIAPESMTTGQARRVLNRINVEIGLRRQGVQNAMDSSVAAQGSATSVGAAKASASPAPAPAGQSGPVKIASDEEYDALPSGAHFIGPDGQTRVKQ